MLTVLGGEGDSWSDLDRVIGWRKEGAFGDLEDLRVFGLHLSKYYKRSQTATSRSVFLIIACINKYIGISANLN